MLRIILLMKISKYQIAQHWNVYTNARLRERLRVHVEMLRFDPLLISALCCDAVSRAGRVECSLPFRPPSSRSFCSKEPALTHFLSKRFHASVLLLMSFRPSYSFSVNPVEFFHLNTFIKGPRILITKVCCVCESLLQHRSLQWACLKRELLLRY